MNLTLELTASEERALHQEAEREGLPVPEYAHRILTGVITLRANAPAPLAATRPRASEQEIDWEQVRREWLSFAGTITAEEAAQMMAAIEEDETIDLAGWKVDLGLG